MGIALQIQVQNPINHIHVWKVWMVYRLVGRACLNDVWLLSTNTWLVGSVCMVLVG